MLPQLHPATAIFKMENQPVVPVLILQLENFGSNNQNEICIVLWGHLVNEINFLFQALCEKIMCTKNHMFWGYELSCDNVFIFQWLLIDVESSKGLTQNQPKTKTSWSWISRLVQVGNGIELEAVGLQFKPYRWRPCDVTWDSSRTVVVIKLRRTSALWTLNHALNLLKGAH